MELKWSAMSPYVRKVMIVAHEAGVADRIKLTPASTQEARNEVMPFNPLGKVPALVLDDGRTMYDSAVICEYLDAEFGGGHLLPASGRARYDVLTRAALADGILDAALLVRQERLRPPQEQSQAFVERNLIKITSGMAALERDGASFGDKLDMGLVGAAAALGYLPVRIPETRAPGLWPTLSAWYDRMSSRPSFAKTAPVAPA